MGRGSEGSECRLFFQEAWLEREGKRGQQTERGRVEELFLKP